MNIVRPVAGGLPGRPIMGKFYHPDDTPTSWESTPPGAAEAIEEIQDTLKSMPPEERKEWAREIVRDIGSNPST